MPKTSIEWTDRSVNPIRARDRATGAEGHWCVKISPGCKGCYASRTQPRFKMHEYVAGNRDKVEVYLDRARFDEVLRRRIPTKWFWCDMTDLFGEWVPDDWIDECVAVMTLTPDHTHQVLTKRADRARRYFDGARDRVSRRAARMWQELPPPLGKRLWNRAEVHARGDAWWPLPNLWLGVSVENQAAADERIPLLLQTPAAVRFVSAEPLLGPVDLNVSRTPGAAPDDITDEDDALGAPLGGVNGIDWVIAGGESGSGARPMHPAWARELRDQSTAAAVPFFFKQWGEWHPVCEMTEEQSEACYPPRKHEYDESTRPCLVPNVVQHASGETFDLALEAFTQGSGAMQTFKVGKKRAGRLLDGVEWSQFPEVLP